MAAAATNDPGAASGMLAAITRTDSWMRLSRLAWVCVVAGGLACRETQRAPEAPEGATDAGGRVAASAQTRTANAAVAAAGAPGTPWASAANTRFSSAVNSS